MTWFTKPKKPNGQYVTLTVENAPDMDAYTVRPASALPVKHPGILVFQEAYGVNDHIRDVANRFAALGFVVIAPELYHRTGARVEGDYADFKALGPHFNALTNEGTVADGRAAFSWLVSQPDVDSARIAAIGYCMGGRAAYLANSAARLAASVSYYGGGIAPALLDRAPRLNGPQLFFWGGKDARIPPEQHRSVADALRAAGKPFVDVEFSEAEHGFFCDQRPSYHAPSARQSWKLTLQFLEEHLGAFGAQPGSEKGPPIES